jgi:molecular chaperone Hsp33
MSTDNDHDCLHRFSFEHLPVRGQWVRLTDTVAAANSVLKYPPPIKSLLNEMLAAVAMFADNLKFEGAVALQSRGNGALIRTLAECREQKYLRGIAHLNEEFDEQKGAPDNPGLLSAWLGEGQLALSLIPPADSHQVPYQGLVALQEASLSTNLESYLLNSEQLPSRIYLASSGTSVTGLLLQRLPTADLASDVTVASEEDAWQSILTLADTVSQAELLALPPAEMLRRLFAEYPCRLHPARMLSYRCTCSRSKSDRTLRVLDDEELAELLREQTEITVDCEFCGSRYTYDAVDVNALISGSADTSGRKTLH